MSLLLIFNGAPAVAPGTVTSANSHVRMYMTTTSTPTSTTTTKSTPVVRETTKSTPLVRSSSDET